MVEKIWIFEVGVPHLFGSADQTKENLIIYNFDLHDDPVWGTKFPPWPI